jgi:thiol-disulfide isomerase/thioredoxin
MKYLMVLMALLFVGCDIPHQETSKINYRPYISTSMAKVVMLDNTPDDVDPVEEQCDGSGWITHGDGHRTPCPGCEACGKGDFAEKAITEESKYIIYHFGAKWCAPCEKMKAQTWSDTGVKEAIAAEDAELYFLDADNKEHKEFFKFYKVSRYPTVIFVAREDLNNSIHKSEGYVGPNDMIKMIGSKLDG